MPYVLRPNEIFVKDPEGSGFLPQNVLTDGTIQEQVAAIEAAGADEIDAIEAKGVATRATIPSDYTTLSDEVSALGTSVDEFGTDVSALTRNNNLINYGYGTDETSSGYSITVVRTGIRYVINGGTTTASSTPVKLYLDETMKIVTGSFPSSLSPLSLTNGHRYRVKMWHVSGTATNTVRIAFYKFGSVTQASNGISVDDHYQYAEITYDSAVYEDGLILGIVFTRANIGNILTDYTVDVLLEDITYEKMGLLVSPWEAVMNQFFGTCDGTVIKMTPGHFLLRMSSGSYRQYPMIGPNAGQSRDTTIGSYTPEISEIMPVSFFGEKIAAEMIDISDATSKYCTLAYIFCSIIEGQVHTISNGSFLRDTNMNTIVRNVISVPDGATHVYFGLSFSSGPESGKTYDVYYKIDKGE